MIETKDISIGQDKWIKWIAIDPDDKNLFEIDSLLEPTKYFWKRLETECVAECCGIAAFGLWYDDISEAVKELKPEEIRRNLEELRNEVIKSACKTIISERLNNLFDKQVFILLIDHILRCLLCLA